MPEVCGPVPQGAARQEAGGRHVLFRGRSQRAFVLSVSCVQGTSAGFFQTIADTARKPWETGIPFQSPEP